MTTRIIKMLVLLAEFSLAAGIKISAVILVVLSLAGSRFAMASDWVSVGGNVHFGEIPVCALVLINGQTQFSCDGTGRYDMTVPVDDSGMITVMVFADGFAPFNQIVTPEEAAVFPVDMRLDQNSPSFDVLTRLEPSGIEGRFLISGNILVGATRVCALVLANGKNMFSCDAALGNFYLDVPADQDGNITLMVFAAGFKPFKSIIDTKSTTGPMPPYSGTPYIDADIITSADPTTFLYTDDAGQQDRLMFDRRVNDWVNVHAFLFNASFSDGLMVEVQVNPEFGDQATARAEAYKYASVIGRLPRCLRSEVQTVSIHRGTEQYGGGNKGLLIHTGMTDQYESLGVLEEILVHEAAHTAFDATHAAAPAWILAQRGDANFISTYASFYPDREDIAESFLPYLAVRHRSDRISLPNFETISQTIPNRIAYFDGLMLDMNPIFP